MEAYVVDIMMKANERTFCDSNKNHMHNTPTRSIPQRTAHTYMVLVVYCISVTAK